MINENPDHVTAYARGSENFKDIPYLDRVFYDGLSEPFYSGEFSRTQRIIVCDGISPRPYPEFMDYVISEIAKQTGKLDGSLSGGSLATGLAKAVEVANKSVRAKVESEEIRLGATTAVVCYVSGGNLYYAWVGDSRLYKFSGGRLTQLTQDHVQGRKASAEDFREFAIGLIDRVDLELRNTGPLEKAIDGNYVVVDSGFTEIGDNDIFVACSDGLVERMRDQDIERILREKGNIGCAVDTMVQESINWGVLDDVTVVAFTKSHQGLYTPKHINRNPPTAEQRRFGPNNNCKQTLSRGKTL